MVHVPTLEKMRKHWETNLETYVNEHPGEWILLQTVNSFDVKETFYKTKEELKEATKKYKGKYGPTFFTEKIPKKTHRFNPDNIGLEFRQDECVRVCPNDGKTELRKDGPIIFSGTTDNMRYYEEAICPDCGYRVFRRPCEDEIKRIEEDMKTLTFP